jgi:hypothetical protein
MFKGINRWVIAWIYIKNFNEKTQKFLQEQISQEYILAIRMWKILNYNFQEIKINWIEKNFIINY